MAWFVLNVQLVMVGEEESQKIPPPLFDEPALHPAIMQFFMVGELDTQ